MLFPEFFLKLSKLDITQIQFFNYHGLCEIFIFLLFLLFVFLHTFYTMSSVHVQTLETLFKPYKEHLDKLLCDNDVIAPWVKSLVQQFTHTFRDWQRLSLRVHSTFEDLILYFQEICSINTQQVQTIKEQVLLYEANIRKVLFAQEELLKSKHEQLSALLKDKTDQTVVGWVFNVVLAELHLLLLLSAFRTSFLAKHDSKALLTAQSVLDAVNEQFSTLLFSPLHKDLLIKFVPEEHQGLPGVFESVTKAFDSAECKCPTIKDLLQITLQNE